MSDDAKRALAAVDELVDRGRRRDRVAAARTAAFAAGTDPELAATAAAVEKRPPARLAGVTPGVHEDHQNPVVRQRVERIRAAMDEGRVTPAEGLRFFEAMSAPPDGEARTVRLIEQMPPGRVPLEARAVVPDPENPVGSGSGPLPAGWSLLSARSRAELAARRERWP